MTTVIWKPISSYNPDKIFRYVLLANETKRWIRSGFKYPNLNRWYYSMSVNMITASTDDDEPTHWAEPIKGPWE